jgi:hypothetical protein
MALKIMPIDEVLAALERDWPQVEWEVDRMWVWVVSDLKPLHPKGCTCAPCTERAAIRKAIGREGLGFIFAPRGHVCPSGAVGHFGHHCERPIKFRRRDKRSKSSEPQSDAQRGIETDEQLTDAELLALIGG